MFKRGWFWGVFVVVLSLSSVVFGQEQFDLAGSVRSEQGDPIVGATVFVWTAQPRVGVSIYCPSCWLDCGKTARTDERGGFVIEDVDPSLLFNVMTAAPGWMATESRLVDPAKGRIEIAMKPRSITTADPRCFARGRVVDSRGEGIPFAFVSPRMFIWDPTPDAPRVHGSSHVEGADPIAVCDDEGRFEIYAPRVLKRVQVRVEARAHATRLAEVPVARESCEIVMTEGAVVRGRLVDASGVPISGSRVGLCQLDRSSNTFLGALTIGTGEDGRFEFVNVPPNQRYVLHGTMSMLADRGAVEPVILDVGGDGEVIESLELRLGPGHSLKGRVVLSDGGELPERISRLLVSCATAWDSQQVSIARDGTFEVHGLPTGRYSISVRAPGYAISRSNPGRMPHNDEIVRLIDRDFDDLVVRLDPDPVPSAGPPGPPALPQKADRPDAGGSGRD